MDGTVLVADDDRTIRTVLTQALTRAGCRVHATSSLITLIRWVDEGKGDLVITDVNMPDGNGIKAMKEIHAHRPDLPVIVISAQNTIVTAVQANAAEAFDYLPKPFDLPDLMQKSAQALALRHKQAAPVEKSTGNDLPLVGQSAQMQAIYQQVARVVNVDLNLLITGNSGTGKSLLARTIHDLSDRRNQAFVIAGPQDLTSLEQIIPLITRAQSGTLVLDEVGDLSDDMQARLVRFLDQSGPNPARILALSQKHDLDEKLRPDLYYRLAGAVIHLPDLSQRLDDLELLCDHFIAGFEQDGIPPRHLSPAALDKMRHYRWPGNLRQLSNTLRHLAVTAQGAEITPDALQDVLGDTPATPEQGGGQLSASVARHVQHYFDMHGTDLPPPGIYHRILGEFERPLIEIALNATGGNQAKCADLLGINRNTLRKKINDLGIEVTRRRKLM